jgi:hypothetical protein
MIGASACVYARDAEEEIMRQPKLSESIVLALFLFAIGQARAQVGYPGPGGTPFSKPVVSPYINLLRAGSPPAINYYGLVRPQAQYNTSIQQLQQQTASNQAALGEVEANVGVPATGHTTAFLNYSHYFPLAGSQLGSAQPSVSRRYNAGAPTTRPGIGSQAVGLGATGTAATRRY